MLAILAKSLNKNDHFRGCSRRHRRGLVAIAGRRLRPSILRAGRLAEQTFSFVSDDGDGGGQQVAASCSQAQNYPPQSALKAPPYARTRRALLLLLHYILLSCQAIATTRPLPEYDGTAEWEWLACWLVRSLARLTSAVSIVSDYINSVRVSVTYDRAPAMDRARHTHTLRRRPIGSDTNELFVCVCVCAVASQTLTAIERRQADSWRRLLPLS